MNPNFDPDVGKSTQFKAGNKGGGRPHSIKAQLKKILEKDGKLKIDGKNVISVNDDGSVIVKVPKSDSLALKLMQWALNGKGTESIKAIQMVMEQMDGKPNQTIDQTNKPPEEFNVQKLTDDELERYQEARMIINEIELKYKE